MMKGCKFLLLTLITIFSNVPTSCEEPCKRQKGPHFLDDKFTIIIPFNEDVVVPENTSLLLNSSVKIRDSQNICVNETRKGNSYTLYCLSKVFHPDSIDASSSWLSLQDVDGYLMLYIEGMKESDLRILFTWWSLDSGWLGDTLISLQETSLKIPVAGRRGRTLSIIFKFSHDTTLHKDVSFTKGNSVDVYNYQFISGKQTRCSSFNPFIYPTFGGPYYITTFENLDCTEVDWYTFAITTFEDESSAVTKATVELQLQEAISVTLAVSHQPSALGDFTELQCNASNDVSSFNWLFQGNTLQVDNNHKVIDGEKSSVLKISHFMQEDLGVYKCHVYVNCSEFESYEINVTLKENNGVQVSILQQPTVFVNSAELLCSATGSLLSTHWLLRGHELKTDRKYMINDTDNGTSTLRVLHFQYGDAGLYECRVRTTENITITSDVHVTLIGQTMNFESAETPIGLQFLAAMAVICTIVMIIFAAVKCRNKKKSREKNYRCEDNPMLDL